MANYRQMNQAQYPAVPNNQHSSQFQYQRNQGYQYQNPVYQPTQMAQKQVPYQSNTWQYNQMSSQTPYVNIDQTYYNTQAPNQPYQARCFKCQQDVLTNVQYKIGIFSYLSAAGFCLFGCWCGCCLIPFFLPWFKDLEHYCSMCNTPLGKCAKI